SPPHHGFCPAYQSAIAAVSASEKPLAIRSMTVPGRWPERNSRIAATISAVARPARRGTGVCTAELAAGQPEHELAPGGASAAAAARGPASEISSASRQITRAPSIAAPYGSGGAQVVVHQWQCADPLAGRRKDRIEHRGRRDGDR